MRARRGRKAGSLEEGEAMNGAEWLVRTLREREGEGRWRQRTPAIVAGLADHVWSLEEWLTLPGIQR